MALILWHAPSPWSPSGYGTQTAIWTQKLTEMGHEVVLSSFWGLAGTVTQWNGLTVLPGFGACVLLPVSPAARQAREPGPGDHPRGRVGAGSGRD